MKFALLTCQGYTNGYCGAFRHLAADDTIDFVVHLGDCIYERHLYRSYRSDPQLRVLLDRHTVIITHDDHESANDCYWDYVNDTLGASDHPLVGDVAALRTLKLHSKRAWLEYVPIRVSANPEETHPHDYSRVYRGFDFGDLARLSMLDTRSYRSPHPCGEGDLFQRYLPNGCSSYSAADRTMLGRDQFVSTRGRG